MGPEVSTDKGVSEYKIYCFIDYSSSLEIFLPLKYSTS